MGPIDLTAFAALFAKAETGGQGSSDSVLFTVIVVAVIVCVAFLAAFILRRRSSGRVPRPHQPAGPEPAGDDPDPERMAGGRAHFTPVEHERSRRAGRSRG